MKCPKSSQRRRRARSALWAVTWGRSGRWPFPPLLMSDTQGSDQTSPLLMRGSWANERQLGRVGLAAAVRTHTGLATRASLWCGPAVSGSCLG